MSKALIVVDVQNIYTNKDSEMYCEDSQATIQRINEIIGYFEKKKLPVLYVQHIHKANGSDLGRMFDFAGPVDEFNFKEGSNEVLFDKNLRLIKDSYQFTKNRYSAFINTDLDKYLKKNGINTIAVVGFMTNFCCESTTRDAHDRDYYVHFITDATGTPALSEELNEETIRKIVSELLSAGYAQIFTTAEYLEQN